MSCDFLVSAHAPMSLSYPYSSGIRLPTTAHASLVESASAQLFTRGKAYAGTALGLL